MGIKPSLLCNEFWIIGSLKNLPTTWGLRKGVTITSSNFPASLKNLPTTWGLRPTFHFA